MFQLLIFFIIFLLFYFHLSSEYKKPKEPIEIFETAFESKMQIQTLTATKQPFIFNIEEQTPILFTINLEEICEDKRGDQVFVCLTDMQEFYKNTDNDYGGGDNTQTHLEIPLNTAISIVLGAGSQSNNLQFSCFGYYPTHVNSSLWKTIYDEINECLLPAPIVVSQKMGFLFGSNGSHSPPEYHTNSAKYLIVLQGNITVKMTTIRNTERLNGLKSVQRTFTKSSSSFTSFINTVNFWEDSKKISRTPFLEFTIESGIVLTIPPFCYWSIQYNTVDTFIITMEYISFMNSISNIQNWFSYAPNYFLENDNDDNDSLDRENDGDVSLPNGSLSPKGVSDDIENLRKNVEITPSIMSDSEDSDDSDDEHSILHNFRKIDVSGDVNEIEEVPNVVNTSLEVIKEEEEESTE